MRNRFKGLDLIYRVPDELWMEVHDIVQETGIKTIPKKNKCKKQNGCLRRPPNSYEKQRSERPGEKEIYTHLNSEFQRIVKRDRKPYSMIKAKK